MPIYEYRCSKCGHQLDALQKLSEAPLTQCPACGEATLVKQVSAAGFQLKGSGWYATDFRGSPKKPKESGEGKDADAKTDGKSGEKSDAKADAKTVPDAPATTKSDAKPDAGTSGPATRSAPATDAS